MKKQQQLILGILLACIIQVHSRTVIEHSPKIRPTNKKLPPTNALTLCPQVDNDETVVTSNEFTIPLNPVGSHSKSYGTTNKNGHISRLKIINEKYIPSTIFGLKNLEHLEIRNTCFFPCKDSTIPSNIQCLASSLTELGIYDTNIPHLPDSIGKLIHLKTLKLSNTGLMSLPDTIGDLSSLTILYLPNNNLKSLPITITKPLLLQELTLRNNPYLHSIEPINNLPSLRMFDTRHCPIEILPQNLSQLTTLYMSNNNLTTLTGIETLGNGTDIRKLLYFGKNHIRYISPGIDQVKNLCELHLNDNELHSLPTNIFNIPTLRYLSVYNNFINKNELQEISTRFNKFC